MYPRHFQGLGIRGTRRGSRRDRKADHQMRQKRNQQEAPKEEPLIPHGMGSPVGRHTFFAVPVLHEHPNEGGRHCLRRSGVRRVSKTGRESETEPAEQRTAALPLSPPLAITQHGATIRLRQCHPRRHSSASRAPARKLTRPGVRAPSCTAFFHPPGNSRAGGGGFALACRSGTRSACPPCRRNPRGCCPDR